MKKEQIQERVDQLDQAVQQLQGQLNMCVGAKNQLMEILQSWDLSQESAAAAPVEVVPEVVVEEVVQ